MNDAERIAAKGVPLRLTDGTEATLRFDMGALMRIEEYFGTLQGMEEQLQQGEKGPIISTMVKIIAAGTGRDPNELAGQLDVTQIESYTQSVEKALKQAFPTHGQAQPNQSNGNYPGPISTGPPPSDLVATIPSSGE